MRTKAARVLLALLALGSCSTGGQPNAASVPPSASTPTRTYASERYGFAITYPADLEATSTFARSYLQVGAWNVFADPDRHAGRPVVALVMPHSGSITAGELRIGVSRAAADIASCAEPPAAARPDSIGATIIDGVAFTSFEAGDAAMNHYLATRSYRTVRNDTCYAIDVLVTGTNPEVYDPPAKPPFTRAQAFATLTPVVLGFRFIGTP